MSEQPNPLIQPPIRTAFTLVEMLVVIGIIGLLAALILPTLIGARQASVNTKCLNNLRQIGMAMSQYMSDNEETVPFAVSSNCWDDPGSPRGATERLIIPEALPVAYYLDNYLKYDLHVWQCPATKVVHQELAKSMRVPEFVQSDLIHRKDETGLFTSGQWRPGYMFMSAHGWKWYYTNDQPTWNKYGMADWKSRNLSGLKLSEIKTTTLQPASEIVLFFDYSSKFHSKSPDDVYDLQQTVTSYNNASPSTIVRGKFQSNFLFLDGHVDTKRYEWQGGLLNAVHHPIPQQWNGEDYRKEYPAAYQASYPD